jgi:hypothetical protein
LWGQKFARELINSPTLFDQVYSEWVGIAAVKSDLIDPNLIFNDIVKINQIIFDNINNMILKLNQMSENPNDFSAEIQITEKLNQIIPNILPDSILRYNFNIFNSPLHKQFFDQFDEIYKSFEITLNTLIQSNQIDQTNTFEEIWKDFIKNINNIYISIADIFWEDRGYLHPKVLRKAKLRAAKAKMFSEAQKIMKMENVPKPTPEQIITYHSMAGIPGLQDISGKIFLY